MKNIFQREFEFISYLNFKEMIVLKYRLLICFLLRIVILSVGQGIQNYDGCQGHQDLKEKEKYISTSLSELVSARYHRAVEVSPFSKHCR